MAVALDLLPMERPYSRPGDARVVRTIGDDVEEFNGVPVWNSNIVRFGGRDFIFSHRAILTFVVMSACNAACKFCSNEITFTPSGPYLHNDARVERIRDFALLAGVTKVAYTGGEPTMHPQRLYELMSAVNPGFNRARLHTNGFGLLKNIHVEDREVMLLPALIDAGLSGVSVSVAHHEPATNREIMRFKPARVPWHGMSDEELRAIAAHASERFTPRLSCVMTEEGVRNVEDMLEYMRWGRSLGFRKFIFRTCSDIPQEFRKPTEYAGYNAFNYLSIEQISHKLDGLAEFTRTYRQRKADSKVDVYKWGDITFDVDESGEEVDPDPKIRRLNVMPNGVAYTSWIDPMAVLFEEDRELAAKAARREFGTK